MSATSNNVSEPVGRVLALTGHEDAWHLQPVRPQKPNVSAPIKPPTVPNVPHVLHVRLPYTSFFSPLPARLGRDQQKQQQPAAPENMPPSRLQQWLSPRAAQRTTTAHDASVTAPEGAILYDFVKNTAGLSAVRETHYLSNKGVREGKSGPPLHIHLRQDEHFEVQQGVLGVVVNGKKHAVSKKDGRISVPSGAR